MPGSGASRRQCGNLGLGELAGETLDSATIVDEGQCNVNIDGGVNDPGIRSINDRDMP